MLYAKLVLMAVFWSGVFPAVSIVVQTMGIFTSVFLRFACAAVLLVLLLVLRDRKLPRLTPRESVLVVGLGVLGILLPGLPAAIEYQVLAVVPGTSRLRIEHRPRAGCQRIRA